jgi:hypothetical protein
MRIALLGLTALLTTTACKTNDVGTFLSSDQDGWFDVHTSRGDYGFFYCTADDKKAPKCYRATLYEHPTESKPSP